MKILVTGGAGFIGSNLVDKLIGLGHEVVIIDNLSSGFQRNLNTKAKFYKLDIRDKKLAEIFERERPEIINHHAAQIDVRKSGEDPIADAEANILGSLNLISNCVQFRVKRVVYASTGGAIYGDPQYIPADEKHPINPISQYGVSKHTVEHYLHLYSIIHGLTYVALRYSNVYGQRQNPYGEAGVVAMFAIQMLTGKRPTIFGPGDKTRDYTHVSDVIEANIIGLKRGENAIYNIGTGVETKDQEIFDTLASVLGYKGKPVYAPLRPGEVYRIALDCNKAKSELGWSPKLSLKQGMAQTAEYYKVLAKRSKSR